MIKLLALDLDDTLLRSDLTISFHARSVVKQAVSAGITIVLATGRIPASMQKYIKFLGLYKKNGYMICNNGTLILETHNGSIVFDEKLPIQTALTVYDLASAEGFAVQVYEDDIMYVSQTNEFTSYDQKLTGLKQIVVENFRTMIEKGCRKLLIPGDPMILPPLESIIRTYLEDDITLFTSKPYFLEILPPHIDKGTSLAKIAEKLGIKREEVLAIGDSMNDEAMIKWAGIGVCMVNGDKRIKDIADIVTKKSNDDDGAIEIIEEYVLKNAK